MNNLWAYDGPMHMSKSDVSFQEHGRLVYLYQKAIVGEAEKDGGPIVYFNFMVYKAHAPPKL
jgi:hypothetical protein